MYPISGAPTDLRRLDDTDPFLRAQASQRSSSTRSTGFRTSIRAGTRTTGELASHRQFLLLGSASLDLIQLSSESLAGRISHCELGGVNVDEAASVGISEDQLWDRGGFPESLMASDDSTAMQRRADLLRSYLERDVPMFAPRIPAETLRRLWTMLAHSTGGLFNASRLAENLAVSGPTVTRYVDLLVDLGLVRRLDPWHVNVGKRVTRSPKIHVRDSGLTHALLDIPDLHALLGHTVVGASTSPSRWIVDRADSTRSRSTPDGSGRRGTSYSSWVATEGGHRGKRSSATDRRRARPGLR